MKQENGEILALQALTYIGANEDILNGFLYQSGAAPDDLCNQISDPAFLAGILDFLLSDEPVLLAFCTEQNIAPELILQARRMLPGGQDLWDG